MARSFLTPLRFPTLTQDPAGSGFGDMYFNSSSKTIRYFDGIAWNDISSSGGEGSSKIQVLSSPPPNPVIGEIYFDSINNVIKVYTAIGWDTENSGGYLDGGDAATNSYYDIINGGGA